MPTMSTSVSADTSAGDKVLFARPLSVYATSPLPTPPATPSDTDSYTNSVAASPTASIHYVGKPVDARGRRIKRSTVRIDAIHINMPPASPTRAPKAAMVDTGTQVGTPQIDKTKAGPWQRRWQVFRSYAAPVVRWLSLIPLFFASRIGFGVNLTDFFVPRTR